MNKGERDGYADDFGVVVFFVGDDARIYPDRPTALTRPRSHARDLDRFEGAEQDAINVSACRTNKHAINPPPPSHRHSALFWNFQWHILGDYLRPIRPKPLEDERSMDRRRKTDANKR